LNDVNKIVFIRNPTIVIYKFLLNDVNKIVFIRNPTIVIYRFLLNDVNKIVNPTIVIDDKFVSLYD
jgi:hypothetical protein